MKKPRRMMKPPGALAAAKAEADAPATLPELDPGVMNARQAGMRDVFSVDGEFSKRRIDRPGRRLGGRVGADRSPLSTAAVSVPRLSDEC